MKKLFALILIAFLLLTAGAALAQLPTPDMPRFETVTGTIIGITNVQMPDGQSTTYLMLETENGPTQVVLSKDAAFCDLRFGEGNPAMGLTVTAVYDTTLPVPMIYPPRFTVAALITPPKGYSVAVSVFDDTLTSKDGSLKLSLSEATSIRALDLTAYDQPLEGKNLLVVYGPVTRSIPAQTAPRLVIVLD